MPGFTLPALYARPISLPVKLWEVVDQTLAGLDPGQPLAGEQRTGAPVRRKRTSTYIARPESRTTGMGCAIAEQPLQAGPIPGRHSDLGVEGKAPMVPVERERRSVLRQQRPTLKQSQYAANGQRRGPPNVPRFRPCTGYCTASIRPTPCRQRRPGTHGHSSRSGHGQTTWLAGTVGNVPRSSVPRVTRRARGPRFVRHLTAIAREKSTPAL